MFGAILWLYADHYKYLVDDKRAELLSATVNHRILWNIIEDLENSYDWRLFTDRDRKALRSKISIMRKSDDNIFDNDNYIDTLDIPSDQINAIRTIINNEKSEPELQAPPKVRNKPAPILQPRWSKRSFCKASTTLAAIKTDPAANRSLKRKPNAKETAPKKPRPGPSGRKATKPAISTKEERSENRLIELPADVALESKRWQPYVRIWRNSVSSVSVASVPNDFQLNLTKIFRNSRFKTDRQCRQCHCRQYR